MALGLEPAPGPLLLEGLETLRTHRELRVPPPENLHVTLAFLGEIDPAQVQLAADAVRASAVGVAGWTVAWGKAGAFPSLARPKVLWLGLADETEARALQGQLSGELVSRGLPPEERPFRPHLTLARVRSGLSREVEEALKAELAALRLPPPALVRGLVLYQSKGRQGSPEYVELASADL